MYIYIPTSSSSLQRILQSGSKPPFVQVDVVRRDDQEYEKAALTTHFVFTATKGMGTYESETLNAQISQHFSPILSSLRSIGESNNSSTNLDELPQWVSSVLMGADHKSLDRNLTEVWLFYGEKSECDAVGVLSRLITSPSAPRYPGYDDPRLLRVQIDSESIAVPLYFCFVEDCDGIRAMVDNRGSRCVRAKIPEGVNTNSLGFNAPLENSDVILENKVWRAFEKFTIQLGLSVADATHEPNGSSTFPDWGVSFNQQGYDVEITRLLAGLVDSRLVTLGRDRREEAGVPEFSDIEPALDQQTVANSISASIANKTEKVRNAGTGRPCILIIVNLLFPIMEPWFSVWKDHDYSAFECVILANRNFETDEFSFLPIHPVFNQHPYRRTTA